MSERTEYWPLAEGNDFTIKNGFTLEARANIALLLIEQWAGGTEDLYFPEERKLVARCFKIADVFIEEAERRGAIRKETRSIKEICARAGELRRISLGMELQGMTKDLWKEEVT